VSARWVAALFAAVILFGFVISARAQDRYWQRTPGAMCVADEGQSLADRKSRASRNAASAPSLLSAV